MIADGLFTRFPKPDVGFALHDGPGRLWLRLLSGRDRLVELRWPLRSASTAAAAMARSPQATIDPVMMAARFVVDVQSVISREKDPTEFGVVTHRRDPWRHRRQHHSRRCRSWSAPSAASSRRCAPRCWRGSSAPRRPWLRWRMRPRPTSVSRGRQGRGERCRRGRHRREGAEGGVRRQVQDVAAGAPPARTTPNSSTPACPRCSSTSVSTIPSASLPPATERHAAPRQPLAAVRAGAEADHRDRRRRR